MENVCTTARPNLSEFERSRRPCSVAGIAVIVFILPTHPTSSLPPEPSLHTPSSSKHLLLSHETLSFSTTKLEQPPNVPFSTTSLLEQPPAASIQPTTTTRFPPTPASSSTMRAFALLVTLFAAILGNASALTDAGKMTTVTAKAVASDERTDDSGCSPDGCLAENTRDGSRDANSRWSCVGTMITGVGGCRIQYTFEDPQDIVKVRIAFHKGDENVRVLNVYVDGSYHSQITSSGEKLGYQNFLLNTSQTSKVIFRLADHADKLDEWLSITEIKFMV